MSKTDVDNNLLPRIPVRKVRITGIAEDIQVVTQGFALPDYDYVAVTYPSATTEQYVFSNGGISGTIVGTINLTYSDSTKTNLTIAAKT